MKNRFKLFIKEISYRIIYISFSFLFCSIICFINKDYYFFFIIKPLFFSFFQYSWELNYINPPDLLFGNLYISFFYSFIIVIPIFFFHLFFYFLPSWQKQESYFFIFIINVSLFTIFSSYIVTFNILFPNIWKFFSLLEDSQLTIVSYKYVPIVQPLLFFCFIIFIFLIINSHYPIFFAFFFQKGIISFWSLFSYRKIIYFSFFFFSTLFSPPDLISQFIFSFLLFTFFEIFCLFCLFFFFILFIKVIKSFFSSIGYLLRENYILI